jgi:hypothetical protein
VFIKDLNDTHRKILLHLVDEMTRDSLSQISGIPSEYLGKKLTELNKWGFVAKRSSGTKVIWRTVRNESTQHFFNLKSTRVGSDPALKFEWDEKLRTVGEIASLLGNEYKDVNEDLVEFTVKILRALKGRADLQNEYIHTTEPTPEQMARMINLRIIREVRKIKFAQMVLDEPFFWKDRPDVGTYIGGRSDKAVNAKAYTEAVEMYKGKRAAERMTKMVSLNKEDLNGCIPNTTFKIHPDKKRYMDVSDGKGAEWWAIAPIALNEDGSLKEGYLPNGVTIKYMKEHGLM